MLNEALDSARVVARSEGVGKRGREQFGSVLASLTCTVAPVPPTTGVGKTCLLLRLVDNRFSTSFITTIGIDFKVRTFTVAGDKKVKLQVSVLGTEFLTESFCCF
jgi:hypothetical protein